MTEPTYVRPIDFDALQAVAQRGELAMQTLLGHDSGARNCLINVFILPPRTGSPVGWHTHEGEQIFYILSGTLIFEIDGRRFRVPAGSIQITPPGVPHRNWNEGPDDVRLISFNTPLPDPGKPIAHPVDAPA
ncbi:cupin domain-containing protein [Amycolatopsis pithecellobii]|uniref:Cupin domain-containing protein n=1 Tax=Amycolatopsis pithecellobii TaxID=664692 RepID=A0A6N7YJN4_9PSEU|nr:cupin domain-containing protein [Amycolatopsis pithecellobii]MTD53107.1 cupin domain-containing protein [Amycolatopsis pithecellobii]